MDCFIVGWSYQGRINSLDKRTFYTLEKVRNWYRIQREKKPKKKPAKTTINHNYRRRLNPQPLRLLRQNLLYLLRMVTKVIHKTIPHLGLMLVPLLAIPRIIRDCEWARGLEHKRD